MTAIPAAPGFDIGRVIQRLFGVLGRNFVAFLLLAVLLVGLPTAIASFLQLFAEAPALMNPASASAASPFNASAFLLVPLIWLVGWMANAVLQGAVIHGAISDLSGTKVTFGEALGTGLKHLLPLIAIGLIGGICVFFGFLVFLVPGVLLALAWSVAAPVAVVERTGVFGAFGRSVELTRGCRIYIFALAIIAGVVGFMLQMTVGAAAAFSGLAMASANSPGSGAMMGIMVGQAVVSLFVQTANAMIGSAGIASVYYELRYVKEGVGAQDLASVFD